MESAHSRARYARGRKQYDHSEGCAGPADPNMLIAHLEECTDRSCSWLARLKVGRGCLAGCGTAYLSCERGIRVGQRAIVGDALPGSEIQVAAGIPPVDQALLRDRVVAFQSCVQERET